MQAGRLNKRITLQRPGGGADALGERSTTWEDVGTVWGSVEPIAARDLIAGGQTQSEITHRIWIRYSVTTASVTADWRVKYGARVFVLSAPARNLREAGDVLEMLCSEGLREE